MKINMDSVLLDEKGRVIKIGEEDFKLSRAVQQCLLSAHDADKQGLDEKLKRYKVQKKVMEAAPLADLTSEDITLVKKLLGEVFPTLIVGQCVDLLES